MTDTVVGSATREVVIGSGRPFVIIGERINPTGRKKLAQEMKLNSLSMGMSSDFETAIAFGATHVRVGSAIFGNR